MPGNALRFVHVCCCEKRRRRQKKKKKKKKKSGRVLIFGGGDCGDFTCSKDLFLCVTGVLQRGR